MKQKRIARAGSTNATLYKLPRALAKDRPSILSLKGETIQRLVNQPIDVRAVADYRRISLESYSPNRTSYVPADVRARLAAPSAGGNGTAAAQSWREPTMLQ